MLLLREKGLSESMRERDEEREEEEEGAIYGTMSFLVHKVAAVLEEAGQEQ